MNIKEIEQLSDFELSCKVLSFDKYYSGGKFMPNEAKSKASTRVDNYMLNFDINDPSDMMPLVFEHRITIATCPATDCWVAISQSKKHASEDDNPLRAAAIVYLLMRSE